MWFIYLIYFFLRLSFFKRLSSRNISRTRQPVVDFHTFFFPNETFSFFLSSSGWNCLRWTAGEISAMKTGRWKVWQHTYLERTMESPFCAPFCSHLLSLAYFPLFPPWTHKNTEAPWLCCEKNQSRNVIQVTFQQIHYQIIGQISNWFLN